MTIRAKILAGCMALMLLTVMLGILAQRTERHLGNLANDLYDDAFMGMSYLRSAQIGFATMVGANAGEEPSPDHSRDQLQDLLGDLVVARDRAMSGAGSQQAEALRTTIDSAFQPGHAPSPKDVARIRAAFETAVERFATDGFRHRQSVAATIDQQLHRGMIVLAASLVASLLIGIFVSRLIARPVCRAVAVAQAIAAGTLDNVIDRTGSGETAELLRALHTMQASIAAALDRIRGLMADQARMHAGELATQHAQMEAAVDNMNQGLCLLDQDGRLQVSNRRFVEMFGTIQTGDTLKTALAGRGLDAMLAGEAGKDVVDFTCDLGDGRVIAISRRPIHSGGWVTTYDDVSQRRASEIRLAHMARHDLLTGLPNRLLLSEYLPEALARLTRSSVLAAVCMDLDRFKSVNDSLGHAAGDTVLCTVADRIRACTRDGDLIVRLGGDEFAILQENGDQPDAIAALCRRLVETVAQPIDVDGHQVVIGCSLGVALTGDQLRDGEALLKSADLALYRAKAAGRGVFRFFEPEMDEQVQARRVLELDLRNAIADSEFEVFYQPLVDPITGDVSGFEALLRWQHSTKGTIGPAVFIPAAEETGLIGAIGAWVLQRACADAAGWPGALKVAVNLSPAQFRCRSIVDDVRNALAAAGLPPQRLEVEITESLLMQDDEAVLQTLHDLRRLGVRIAMDDFGTGYSSLSYLRRFPFDKLKIDQSFVKGMIDEPDCFAIVRAVISLGRTLGIAVNAEGVETHEQFRMLRNEGCGEVQGYLFSRPKPRIDVPNMIAHCPEEARIGPKLTLAAE